MNAYQLFTLLFDALDTAWWTEVFCESLSEKDEE